MQRIVLLIAAIAFSAVTSAAGLPFAVESLAKAKELTKTGSGKHLLIFYTSPY